MLCSSALEVPDKAPKYRDLGLRAARFINTQLAMYVQMGSFSHLAPASFTEGMLSCFHRLKSLCINDTYTSPKLQHTEYNI